MVAEESDARGVRTTDVDDIVRRCGSWSTRALGVETSRALADLRTSFSLDHRLVLAVSSRYVTFTPSLSTQLTTLAD